MVEVVRRWARSWQLQVGGSLGGGGGLLGVGQGLACRQHNPDPVKCTKFGEEVAGSLFYGSI